MLRKHGPFWVFENGIALKSVQLLRRTRTALGKHFVKRVTLELRLSKMGCRFASCHGYMRDFLQQRNNAKIFSI